MLLERNRDEQRNSVQSLPTDLLSFLHLDHMLTEIGLWQHSDGPLPHMRHGYSIDDEARGLIVGLRYWQTGIELDFQARLAQTCFEFLQNAAITEGEAAGRYHNFCDKNGRWLDSVGSDDSFGRTFWALGIAHAVNAPFAPRAQVEEMLQRSLPAVETLTPWYLRAHAFVILGLEASHLDNNRLKRLADVLVDAYKSCADDTWRWFEEGMTYCNARLPQALFAASRCFPTEPQYMQVATQTLDFLLEKTRNSQGSYDPIGNERLTTRGWFLRSDTAPARFDQQPVDAGALVECCVEAWHATQEPRYRQAARDAFEWYLGSNAHHLPVYNSENGGVADALHQSGLSINQGAESVLSFHMAYQALQTLK